MVDSGCCTGIVLWSVLCVCSICFWVSNQKECLWCLEFTIAGRDTREKSSKWCLLVSWINDYDLMIWDLIWICRAIGCLEPQSMRKSFDCRRPQNAVANIGLGDFFTQRNNLTIRTWCWLKKRYNLIIWYCFWLRNSHKNNTSNHKQTCFITTTLNTITLCSKHTQQKQSYDSLAVAARVSLSSLSSSGIFHLHHFKLILYFLNRLYLQFCVPYKR